MEAPACRELPYPPKGLYLRYEAAARLSIPYYRVHDSAQDMGSTGPPSFSGSFPMLLLLCFLLLRKRGSR
jgi:hypothetical protein